MWSWAWSQCWVSSSESSSVSFFALFCRNELKKRPDSAATIPAMVGMVAFETPASTTCVRSSCPAWPESKRTNLSSQHLRDSG